MTRNNESAGGGEVPTAEQAGERGYMTVGELVRLLSTYPPDLRVVVSGYEGGYDDLGERQVQRLPIGLNALDNESEGPHDDARYGFGERTDSVEIVEAVALHRRS